MAEKNPNKEIGVEGEDYVVITPENNTITIIPWSTRLINDTGRPLHIDLRHTNLMIKVLYISDAEEKSVGSDKIKEKIAGRIGKEL